MCKKFLASLFSILVSEMYELERKQFFTVTLAFDFFEEVILNYFETYLMSKTLIKVYAQD